MEFHHQYYFFTLFSLIFVVSHARNLSPEVYWKVKLHNTLIPAPIKDALNISEKAAYNGDGNIKMSQSWEVFSWYHAVTDNELQKFLQPWGVSDGVSKNDHNENHLIITPYFFETDLHKGKKLILPSLKNHNSAPILPRKVVDSIPFSADRIEEILDHFSVDKDSESAKVIKKTIKLCEEPAGDGEVKYCATSLESMVDFTSSQLGTNDILAISTKVEKESSPDQVQTYTITEEVKEKTKGTKGVVCHKMGYPYAVHFCHDVGSTRTFMVSMVGDDGTKVNAVSICHEDTAYMNPKSLPFQLLDVKPGDKPICHFILDDEIALFPSVNTVRTLSG